MILRLICFLCFFFSAAAKPYVIVSVAPYKYFAERIGGETIDVGLIVPAGASSHTFEPSPKQMIASSKADLWFGIGESFENKVLPVFKQHNPKLKWIDLRQGVHVIKEAACRCHAGSIDPHFWLSPKVAEEQVQIIAEGLSANYPEHRALYQAEAEKLAQELQALDKEIATTLASLDNRCIMVSHPAYAYYAREYRLTQLSIETEGRDPTPKQLTRIFEEAKKAHIQAIFTQPQYSDKGAQLIAKGIHAHLVSLDPYAEAYFPMMRKITEAFARKDSDGRD